MVATNQKNNISKFIFVISLLMLVLRKYLTAFFWDYEIVGKIQSLLLYLPIALLLLQFISNKYHTKKEIYLLVGLMALYVITREGSILIFILMALGITNIDDNYVVKKYFVIHALLFIGLVVLVLLLPDISSQGEYHYKWENGYRVLRDTFGLSNPNAVFYYLMPIYGSYIYLRFDKYNIIDRIVMIALTLLVFNVTSSRTGFIAIAGGLVFVEILKFIDLNKYEKVTKYIKYIPIIFAVISILIGTVFHKVQILNSVLSSRPKNWYIYLISRGNMFSLFGNSYTPGVRAKNPLDNSYIYVLCFLGIVAFFLLMYVLYKGLDYYVKENKRKYIAVAILFFIYGLAENILLEVSLNFTLLLIIKQYIVMDDTKVVNMYDYKNYKEESKVIKGLPKKVKETDFKELYKNNSPKKMYSKMKDKISIRK